MVLKKAFKETFKLIKKKKLLFIFVFLLQIFIFGTLAFSSFLTIIPFAEKAESVLSYVSTVKMDSLESMSQFGDDPLQFYYDYKDALTFLKQFGLFIVIILLFLNNLMWMLVNSFSHKVDHIKYFVNYLIVNAGGFLVLFYLLIELIKSLLNDNKLFASFFGVLIALVLYLLFVFIASIDTKNIDKVVEKGLKSIFKLPVFLAVLINLVLILLVSLLFNYVVELSLTLISVMILLFTFVFVWTKLFLIEVVQKV